MTTAQRTLRTLARQQRGVVSAQQVRDLGITQKAVQSLLAREVLTKDVRGVYRFPDEEQTQGQELAVAMLWTQRPSAALSHNTALVVRNLPRLVEDDQIHVTVAKKERIRIQLLDNLDLHYDNIEDATIEVVDGLRAVNVEVAVRQVMASAQAITNLDELLQSAVDAGFLGVEAAAKLAADI